MTKLGFKSFSIWPADYLFKHLIPSSSIEKTKLVTNPLNSTHLTDPQRDLSPEKNLTLRETSLHLRLQADQIIKTKREATSETSEIVPIWYENLKFGKDNEAKKGSDVRIFQRENQLGYWMCPVTLIIQVDLFKHLKFPFLYISIIE